MSTTARITIEQYEERVARGDFDPREEHHVELIRGEVVPMCPVGDIHARVVDNLNEWSILSLPRSRVWVRVQQPLGLAELDSVPEPDLAWVTRDYPRGWPRAEHVHLLIEVADSSLAKDRGEKSELYAEAGIRDYWIVNLIDRAIEVRRDPKRHRFRSVVSFAPGEEVRPLAFPDMVLVVSSLFD